MKAKEYFVEDPDKEEAVRIAVMLSAAIGILNACTYLTRGQVFASSQSGNVLYLGLDLARQDFSKFPKYLFTVLMFGTGVFLGEHFHNRYRQHGWRKISTIVEMVLILIATLMPDSWNLLANPLFGLTCGLQSITYKRFHNITLATVNLNRNITNAIEQFTRYFHLKEPDSITKGLIYLTIISTYLLGIIIGALAVPFIHHYVSLLSIVCLGITLYFMKPDQNPN